MRHIGLVVILCLFTYHIASARTRHKSKNLSAYQENNVDSDENLRPIVGILSLEPPSNILKAYKWCESYIAASYVKFVEMAGARVVPIFINRSDKYYENVFNGINGLLIPGGGIDLQNFNGSGYARAGQILYNMAVTANDKGDYFPIWAVCLGSELLSILVDPKNTYHLTNCSCYDVALPLNMTKDYEQSRLFHDLPSDVFASLTTLPVTANFHRKCLTPESVSNSSLKPLLHVLSTNKDANQLSFVSTYEVIKYPFYAVQWHPEKNPFEWSAYEKSLPHTSEAVRVSQYMANFFISEVRKNTHKFGTEKEEQDALIYNQRPFPSFNFNSSFIQIYAFKNDTKDPFH